MRRRIFRIEQLESKEMLSATIAEYGGIGYFLDAAHAAVNRYDITNETWLSSVALGGLAGTPTVAHVDGDGIYVAVDRSVFRYTLDGSNRTHVLNTQHSVQSIHTDGNLLFINDSYGYYADVLSLDKATNTLIDTRNQYIDALFGSSIATSANCIFGRTQGLSPSDITYLNYTNEGKFTTHGNSPYHGAYSGATTTWVFPNGSKVVDDSGQVYAVSDLTHVNSFCSSISDIAFLGGDVPVILNGQTVTAYSPQILPTGSATLPTAATKIFVNSNDVVAFTPDASAPQGYRVEIVPLSSLHAATPGQPIDPVGLSYTPDEVVLSADGKVLLYSKAYQSIFRWDPATQVYDRSIPLIGAASYMAYSSATNTVYLAYASGLITKIDPNNAEPEEEAFATVASRPIGLSVAGSYLFVADGSGPWGTHYTFAPDSVQVDAKDWNYYSSEYVWSDANQKMYFFRDGTSPNDLLCEQINANGTAFPSEPPGGIGTTADSPLHDSFGFSHPIRVAPDGSIVVLGSGMIHDAETLQRLPTALGNSISDAAWLGGKLFTVRDTGNAAQLQYWTQPTYDMAKSVQATGRPHALMAVSPDNLLCITLNVQGVPVLRLFDADLNLVKPANDVQPPQLTLVCPQLVSRDAPWATATASDLDVSMADGTTVVLDVDLNRDGDFDDGGELGYMTASLINGTATFPAPASLPDGQYTLRARASDEAGNVGTSATASTDIDTTPPSISISDPSSGWTENNCVTYTISYNDRNWADGFLDAADLTLIRTGTANGIVTVDWMSYATTRTVTISNITGKGTLAISIAAGTAADRAGNVALSAGPSAAVEVVTAFQSDGADGLPGVTAGAMAWGDYDNDGDLDLLLAGDNGTTKITRVYRNDGSGSFSDISAGLVGVADGSVAWGDYDNDSWLDILISGYTSSTTAITKVYHNDGSGHFHDIAAGLTGVGSGSAAWGDYDNDGRLDILLAGSDPTLVVNADQSNLHAGASLGVVKVYHNDGNGIFRSDRNYGSTTRGVAAWGDYDRDGLLDFVVTGQDGSLAPSTQLFHNEGNGWFAAKAPLLPGFTGESVAWGDYDNDGQLDLLLTGTTVGSPSHSTVVLRNMTGGGFQDIQAGLEGVFNGSALWGDYDHDQWLDVLVTGEDGSGHAVTKIYHNDHGTFSDAAPKSVLIPLTPDWYLIQAASLAQSSLEVEPFDTTLEPEPIVIGDPGFAKFTSPTAVWGDFDNDGCLELLVSGKDSLGHLMTKDYQAQRQAWQQQLNAPYELTAKAASATAMDLSWSDLSEVGRSYSVRVGTTPGGCDVVSPMVAADGFRRTGQPGWIQVGTWRLQGLTPGKTYYWSVQAVDNALRGSVFATEQSFVAGEPTSFALALPSQQSYVVGSDVSIQWNAKNVVPDATISLCYDEDKLWWNGNEHWIEIDQVKAANGAGSYTWRTTNVAPGTYYLAGYLMSDGQPIFSHLTQSVKIQVPAPTFTLLAPTSGTFNAGDLVPVRWNVADSSRAGTVSLCYDEDKLWWNGNEHWIEIDRVRAGNGTGEYYWNTAGLKAGTYYLAGYFWDGSVPVFSHLTNRITVTTDTPTFSLTGPTSGNFITGQTISIAWNADKVAAGSTISLCYDSDRLWNGNEHWIEIDRVAASNGSGMYSWNTTGLKPGNYYIGGYLWAGGRSYFSHVTQAVSISVDTPIFTLTGPTAGMSSAGQNVQIQWNASNVATGSTISLCYDIDRLWNGNEHWIEVDRVSAANGSGSYNWNTAGVKTGTYYVAGYLWTGGHAVFSHLTQPISITTASPSFALLNPATASVVAGQNLPIQWNASNVTPGSKISLCYDSDRFWNGNEHWIEIDQVSAVNGTGSYVWKTTGVKSGQYYIAGYLWNGSAQFSRASQPVTVTATRLLRLASSGIETEVAVTDDAVLSDISMLSPIADEAIRRWTAITKAKLADVFFEIADLPDGVLGETAGRTIRIDRDAVGQGWFIDQTPAVDEEFAASATGELLAGDSPAKGRVDLLTVVEHELGHLLGLDDLDVLAENLMSASLATGTRRAPQRTGQQGTP